MTTPSCNRLWNIEWQLEAEFGLRLSFPRDRKVGGNRGVAHCRGKTGRAWPAPSSILAVPREPFQNLSRTTFGTPKRERGAVDEAIPDSSRAYASGYQRVKVTRSSVAAGIPDESVRERRDIVRATDSDSLADLATSSDGTNSYKPKLNDCCRCPAFSSAD